MKEREKSAALIGTAVVVSGGLCILGIYSSYQESLKNSESSQTPKSSTFGNSVDTKNWDCSPIPEGSWLTNELRKRGEPGIDPGPYKIIHLNGTVHDFQEYGDLPNLVYPGQEFCIKKVEPNSLNINPDSQNKIVYEKTVRSENKKLLSKSLNIVSSIREKQGF